MQKTKIEWCDYSLNPVKGLCPMACPYCYARAMYKRFKWNPEIRFENPPIKMPPEGSKIFVGSTMELFGDWIKPQWLKWLFGSISEHKKHTFIFLTKQPIELIKWSPFPDNCWIGVSPITNGQLLLAIGQLQRIQASIKFLSIEPMLNEMDAFKFAVKDNCLDWVIIGAQSPYSVKTLPKWEWVREIIDAADKAGIPIFLKDNLRLPKYSCEGSMPYYKKHPTGTMELRQEFPNVWPKTTKTAKAR